LSFCSGPKSLGAFFKFTAHRNFAEQGNAAVLRRLHQLIEQTKWLPRLQENLRTDSEQVKPISLQSRLYLKCGI
jgi:hypothetical protein